MASFKPEGWWEVVGAGGLWWVIGNNHNTHLRSAKLGLGLNLAITQKGKMKFGSNENFRSKKFKV